MAFASSGSPHCQVYPHCWLFRDDREHDEGDDGSGSREKFLSELCSHCRVVLCVWFQLLCWEAQEHPPRSCEPSTAHPFLCESIVLWSWERKGKPSGCGLHGECSSDGGGGCRVTLLQSGLGDLYVTAGSFFSAWQSRAITWDTAAWQVREDFRADSAEKMIS